MTKATCSIDDCPNPRLSRGWCSRHYKAWKTYGDPLGRYVPAREKPCIVDGCARPRLCRERCSAHYQEWRRTEGTGPCTIDGCDRPHFGRGWCEVHYGRWKSNGDPLVVRAVIGATPEDRLWHYVERGEAHECWPWTSTLCGDGYGVITVDGRQLKAHRFAYELLVGPIPEGLVIDHVCHNLDTSCVDGQACPHRRCVNPAHMEPVTPSENTARAHRHAAGLPLLR